MSSGFRSRRKKSRNTIRPEVHIISERINEIVRTESSEKRKKTNLTEEIAKRVILTEREKRI